MASDPTRDGGTTPGDSTTPPERAGGPSTGPAATPAAAPSDLRLRASMALGILWIAAPPIAGTYLLVKLGPIGAILNEDPTLGFWAYVAVFAVSAGLGILPTYAQAILGGWVFGMWGGLAGAMLGFTGGAAIGMLFSRAVAGSSVERWIQSHPKASVVTKALVGGSPGKTFGIVALVRLPPNSPFAITNLALGTTGVPFFLALAATAVGMLPRTAVACLFASQAAATGAEDIQSLVKEGGWTAFVVGLVVMFAVVAVIGKIASHALERVTAGENK
jgi:uncharacterized membrane protein YdjX (TVP38/TMEM64 family)